MKLTLKNNLHWALMLMFVLVGVYGIVYWALYLYTPESSWESLPQHGFSEIDSRAELCFDNITWFILWNGFFSFLIGLIGLPIRSRTWKNRFCFLLVVSHISVMTYLNRCMFILDLPPDEAYIAYFDEHREDLERLVELYRDYDNIMEQPQYKGKKVRFSEIPEVADLLDRAGVERFTGYRANWISVEIEKEVFGIQEVSSDRYGFSFLAKYLYYTAEAFDAADPSFLVLESLDDYPPGYWPKDSSIVRQLTTHWILKVRRNTIR